MIPKQIGSKEMKFNPKQEYWQAFEAKVGNQGEHAPQSSRPTPQLPAFH